MRPCGCLACQLHRLTDRVIEERVMTSKFSQLADDIETDLADLDKDADALNERRLAIKERARLATNAHHSRYDGIEGGLKRLEDAADAMGGRKNSTEEKQKGNEEGSGDTLGTSFQPKT